MNSSCMFLTSIEQLLTISTIDFIILYIYLSLYLSIFYELFEDKLKTPCCLSPHLSASLGQGFS